MRAALALLALVATTITCPTGASAAPKATAPAAAPAAPAAAPAAPARRVTTLKSILADRRKTTPSTLVRPDAPFECIVKKTRVEVIHGKPAPARGVSVYSPIAPE